MIQFSVGPMLCIVFFRVFPEASESKWSLRVCAKLSKCTEERQQLMYLLKACCFVNSDIPSLHRHHGEWMPQGDREGREGCKEGRVTAPWFIERCREKTDRETETGREGGNSGGRVTASVASQCPRREERELCSRLPDRDSGCWLMTFYGHNMQSYQFQLVKIQFSNIERCWIVVVLQPYKEWHTFTFVWILHRKLELGLVPYGGIIYFIPESTASPLFSKEQNLACIIW